MKPSDVRAFAEHHFEQGFPHDENSLKLQAGAWKFAFDTKSTAEVIRTIRSDGRPRFCAEAFEGFEKFRILEFGPSDGYNTAGLEFAGASEITSVEANGGAFMRCLLLKNFFQLRAKFLLGDFVAFIQRPELQADLVYASGILYHLLDPIDFLADCARVAPNLFLWTMLYDEQVVANHHYEKDWFKPEENVVKSLKGRDFTYHRHYYQAEIVERADYAGGLHNHSHWLTQQDLMEVLDLLGYRILRTVPDDVGGIPALNILATRTAEAAPQAA